MFKMINKIKIKRYCWRYLILFDWYSFNYVIFVIGCIGDDGKCYDIGDEFIEDCFKFMCIVGGVM